VNGKLSPYREGVPLPSPWTDTCSGPVHAALILRPEPLDSPASVSLVERVQQDYVVRYGGRDRTPMTPAEFVPPHGQFLVGYLGDVPVACGGVRVHDGVAELKRMYLDPGLRRRGVARVLLLALEDAARGLGASRVILESGTKQPEALAFYVAAGYERIPNFGIHAASPTSRCFAKTLG